MKTTGHQNPETKVRYNPTEVNALGISLFAALIVLMVAVVLPGTKRLLRHLENQAALSARSPVAANVSASRVNFPAPREQLNAPADLATFSAREQAELNSYGWIDRRAGIVRLPITRAMELLAQRASSNLPTGPSLLNMQQQRPTNAVITGGSQ
jgi:hypothetical protein